MRRLGLLLLVPASLLYPLAIYTGLDRAHPALLASLLALGWLARLSGWRGEPRPWPFAAMILAYCVLLAWQPWPHLDRWYPCLISLALAIGFASSLYRGMPVIERLARLQEPDLPAAGIAYTRKVTWVWLGFFVFNGSVAGLLSLWGNLRWWALYNGALAYLLMGLLFAAEYGVRRHVRRLQPAI